MSSRHTAHRAPRVAAAIAAVLAVSSILATPSTARAAEARPLRIGIIGAGRIGGTLAALWAKAGHEVLVSSRHPEQLQELARSLGPRGRAGTPREAAVFGDVVLVSGPQPEPSSRPAALTPAAQEVPPWRSIRRPSSSRRSPPSCS
jgi:glutamyl-tRNA reductase